MAAGAGCLDPCGRFDRLHTPLAQGHRVGGARTAASLVRRTGVPLQRFAAPFVFAERNPDGAALRRPVDHEILLPQRAVAAARARLRGVEITCRMHVRLLLQDAVGRDRIDFPVVIAARPLLIEEVHEPLSQSAQGVAAFSERAVPDPRAAERSEIGSGEILRHHCITRRIHDQTRRLAHIAHVFVLSCHSLRLLESWFIGSRCPHLVPVTLAHSGCHSRVKHVGRYVSQRAPNPRVTVEVRPYTQRVPREQDQVIVIAQSIAARTLQGIRQFRENRQTHRNALVPRPAPRTIDGADIREGVPLRRGKRQPRAFGRRPG